MIAPSMLITIVSQRDREKMARFFENERVPVNLVLHGKGTATSEILALIGAGEPDKTIFICFATAESSRRVTRNMSIALSPDNFGAVAFALPVAALGGQAARLAFQSGTDINIQGSDALNLDKQNLDKDGLDKEGIGVEYELIVAVANQGNASTVMDAARGAGARGGTTIRAGGTSDPSTETFFNMQIHHEKDLILIIVPSPIKQDVMRAIMKEAGSGTPAGSIVFSLPVTDTVGLKFA